MHTTEHILTIYRNKSKFQEIIACMSVCIPDSNADVSIDACFFMLYFLEFFSQTRIIGTY